MFHPATFLKVFISSSHSLEEFLAVLMYTIITYANKNALGFYFLVFIHLVSFSCLIALPRISNIILNRYAESKQTYFVPDFRELALSFCPFNLILAVKLR